VLNIGLDQF